MKFGKLDVSAEGAILAHSVRRGSVSFKKGRMLTATDVTALAWCRCGDGVRRPSGGGHA
jgi:hypothetical protein